MIRLILPLALAAVIPVSSALAKQSYSSHCRPYVVEEICDAPNTNCRAHMLYAPGQSMADNAAHTYWYAVPRHYAHQHHSRARYSGMHHNEEGSRTPPTQRLFPAD